MGSDGELEQEVDEDRIVTDQDREQAAELKQKANKAFASKSLSPTTTSGPCSVHEDLWGTRRQDGMICVGRAREGRREENVGR